jgi:hypothetical protein
MARKWIQGAIKHPGALHKQLGVPQGQKIPAGKLAKAAKAGGKLGARARLAETLKGFHHGGGKSKSMKKQNPMGHPGHPMNLEMGHAKFSGGNKGYNHDTSSHIPGTSNLPAQHHDKAHPAGPGHPSIHSFHNIGHRDHGSKMSEG